MVRGSLSVRPEHFKGDMIGFLSSILFSCYVLSSKGLRQRIDNVPFSLSLYLLSAIGFFLLALSQGTPLTGFEEKTWAMFAALGIGSTLLGHSLFTYCLNFFNVNLMSVSTLSEPIFTALVAYWLFEEPVRGATLLGFVLVTVGIFVLYWPHLRGLWGRSR